MRISRWRLDVRPALALMTLLLAASCAAQQEGPHPSLAPTAVAPPALSRPTMVTRRTSAKPSNAVSASYQGDEYAGHRTASGEQYDPDALTAASRNFPIGSLVMVTNPDTGRSVKVRINDRPGGRGRGLDLSKRAAQEIGITRKGVARVGVKRVDSKSEKSESSNPHTGSSSTSALKL